jgi:hypothetical protein
MSTDSSHPLAALKFEAEVCDQGRIELSVPYAPGARVVVFVMPERSEAMDDLVAAAQTSLDFWDNPFDDQNDRNRASCQT